jgi:hypothetical protein
MRRLNLAFCLMVVTTAGCSIGHDKNGNPYGQVPGRMECSWLTSKTSGCPEIIGPPQKTSFGQNCQTFKHGSIYETRCE